MGSKNPQIQKSSLKRYYWTVVFLYSIVIVFNINTSSLGGMDYGQNLESQLGVSRWIRSDEFLRTTPYLLGMIRSHGNLEAFTTLDFGNVFEPSLPGYSGFFQFPTWISQPVYQVLIEIGSEKLFGLVSFFYIFVFFLIFPSLLLKFGISRNLAIAATIVTFASPCVAWWSFSPIQPVAVAAAFSFLSILSFEKYRVSKIWILYSLTAGYLMASMIFLYQRWSISITLIFIMLIFAHLIGRGYSILRIPPTYSIILAGAVTLGYTFFQLKQLLEVASLTVYPGNSTSGSYLIETARLLAGPTYALLQGRRADEFVYSNVSEFSGGFLCLGLIASVIFYSNRAFNLSGKFSPVTKVLLVSWWILLAWCTLEIPFSSELPMKYFVPYRLFVVIHLISPLLFFMVLHESQSVLSKFSKFPEILFLSILVLTWIGGSALRQAVPSIRAYEIILISFLFAFCVSGLFSQKFRTLALCVFCIFSLSSTIFVNPIRTSFGVYNEKYLPEKMNSTLLELRTKRFAIDQKELAAVFNSLAIPSESGQQFTGPNRVIYQRFFPDSPDIWNRGGSYVYFAFNEKTDGISNPFFDNIRIATSPCGELLRFLKITDIVSSQKLDRTCLQERTSFYWMGEIRYWYAIRTPSLNQN